MSTYFSIQTYNGNLLVDISDHLPQFAFLETGTIKEKNTTEKYYQNWNSFNNDLFSEEFKKVDWKSNLNLEKLDLDTSFKNFFNRLTTMVDKHVPLKKVLKKQCQRKPWITHGIQKFMQLRDKLFKQLKSEKEEEGNSLIKFQQYKTLRNQIFHRPDTPEQKTTL